MKRSSLTVLFAVSCSLAGCATSPISTQAAKFTPSDRIHAAGAALSKPRPNAGEVVIKRDSGMMGGACTTRIYVDGTSIADIDVSEKIVLYVPEGDHIFGAEPNGLCGGGLSEVKSTIKAGTHSAFRFGITTSGTPGIFPTAF